MSELALVAIGVDFYQNSATPSLSCAANDAEALYALLTSRRLKTDATLRVNEQATVKNVREAVVSAARKVHENGTLLLTFSGHGVPVNFAKVEGTNDRWEAAFLTHEFNGAFGGLPFGLDPEELQGAFTLQDVKQWLKEEAVSPSNIVVIMDACGAGAAITHDATGGVGVRIDGKSAIARRFAPEIKDVLTNLGVPRADNVAFDSSRVDWPSGSRIFALSAATGGGVAHESPEIGHGFLSLLVLEWFNKVFLERPEGVDNLEKELFDYVTQESSRLIKDAGQIGFGLQKPEPATSGVVAIDNTDSLVRTSVANSVLSLGPSMPVPKPTGDTNIFEKNVLRIAEAFTREVANVGDANSVVEMPRFLGTRALLQAAAARVVEQVGVNRPVVYLGLGRFRRIIPLIGSLETAFDSLLTQQADVAAGSPVVADRQTCLIDNFVERLKEMQACVIAPFRRAECDELMVRFLKRCVFEPDIRIVLALYADEPVPEWARVAHYHRIDLQTPPAKPFEEQMLDLGIDIELKRIPDVYFNATVVRWLEILEQQTPDKNMWKTNFYMFVYPSLQSSEHTDQSGNKTRAILNVLEALLPILNRESPNSLSLLKAMSTVALSRSKRLIRHLWNQLEAADLIVDPDSDGIDAVLKRMADYQLVRDSDPRADLQQSHLTHYFVHSLVRKAALEHDRKEHKDTYPTRREFWHKIAGTAMRDLLQNDEFDEWWPRAVLAHESIRHLLAGDCPKDACRVLLDNWKELVDAGYHEVLVQWCRRLYPDVAPTSLDNQKTLESLRLLIPLLLNQQTLHRHRHEWGRIRELHEEIVQRTSGFRPKVEDGDLELGPDSHNFEIERWYWKSRHNVGNVRFIHKDFEEAAKQYEKCHGWAAERLPNTRQTKDVNLECASRIRQAHCHVLQPDFDRATTEINTIGQLIDDLNKQNPVAAARHRRHLRSVQIEEARIKEDNARLYELAMQAWTESLKRNEASGGGERLDLAISNIHMGWASMVRGEFLRAWRHALQARRYLNDRGIPEHWWYCETERIAALAIAYIFRHEILDLQGDYTPWFEKGFGHSTPARHLFTEAVLERQRRSLEKLIRVSIYQNPWRAAELISALGEFLAYALHDPENGAVQLREALRIAGDKSHEFLEARIHEALAVLPGYTAAENHFRRCYQIVERMGIDDVTLRCKSNANSP